MKTDKTIYDLELHESLNLPIDMSATRVPGGWIYRFWDYQKQDYYPNAIFIPFDNEFMGRTKTPKK